MSTLGGKRLVRPGGNTPPKKKGKTKEDSVCVKCSKQLLKDEDALECVWCDGVKHRECLQIRVDQYSSLTDLPSSIVFFCSRCVELFLVALVEYDKFIEVHEVVNNKLDKFGVTLSNKFSLLKDELSSLSDKIGKSVQELTKLDNQIKGSLNQEFEKSNESMVATLDDWLSKSETSGTNDKSNLPTKSYSQIASTTVKEQREKEKRQLKPILSFITFPSLPPRSLKLGSSMT